MGERDPLAIPGYFPEDATTTQPVMPLLEEEQKDELDDLPHLPSARDILGQITVASQAPARHKSFDFRDSDHFLN